MKHTKGLLARWGLAAALLLLGFGVARPASATVTVTVSRTGSVSGGVATVSGTLTSDVGESVEMYVELTQYLRGSLRALGAGSWSGWVPQGQVTAWIVNVHPGGPGDDVAFQVGPAAVDARAYFPFPDYVEVMGTVSLKRR
jgi:hypothetical protein